MIRLNLMIAGSFRSRARGLLGTNASWGDGDRALLIVRCKSVHTFGMAYALDIAFVSEHGIVMRVERKVKPNRALWCRQAAHVIERPHCANDSWFQTGEKLSLIAMGE